MTTKLTAATAVIPFAALLVLRIGKDVRSADPAAAGGPRTGQAENKWVVAGDMLFPEGGYQLTPSGQAALSQYVPRLQNLQNAKVVVYGYTDNLPVGPALRQAGITNNIDLSSKRADTVVAYFRAQGVNPNILSAKGFGDTHAVAPNDTPQGRAQNRRIEIVLEGPGA